MQKTQTMAWTCLDTSKAQIYLILLQDRIQGMAGAKFRLDFGQGVTLNRSPGNCHIPKAARAAGQPRVGFWGPWSQCILPAQHIPWFSDCDIPLFCPGTTSFLLFHPLEVQDWSQCWTNPTPHLHPHIPCETSQKLFTWVNQTQILDSFPQDPGARGAVAAADPLCLPRVVFLLLFYGKKRGLFWLQFPWKQLP